MQPTITYWHVNDKTIWKKYFAKRIWILQPSIQKLLEILTSLATTHYWPWRYVICRNVISELILYSGWWDLSNDIWFIEIRKTDTIPCEIGVLYQRIWICFQTHNMYFKNQFKFSTTNQDEQCPKPLSFIRGKILFPVFCLASWHYWACFHFDFKALLPGLHYRA